MTLAALRCTGDIFLGYSSIVWYFSHEYSRFWGDNHRGKTLFSSHHLKGTQSLYNMFLLMLTMIAVWDGVCQIFFCTLTPAPCFPYCHLWKDITMPSSHLGSGELSSFEDRVSAYTIWNCSAWGICFFLFKVCIYSVVYASMDTCIFCFIIWVIL